MFISEVIYSIPYIRIIKKPHYNTKNLKAVSS